MSWLGLPEGRAPALGLFLLSIVGLVLAGFAFHEIVTESQKERERVEREKVELREMIKRIDERTERLENSCMEVCGD